MKTMIRYLRPFFGFMSIGLVIKIAGTLIELVIPYLFSYMIDEVVPKNNMKEIFLYGFYMLLCAVGALVFNIVANRMASKVAMNASRKIRHDLFDKVIRLSAEKADFFTVPSLESRLTSDTYHVHHAIGVMQRLGVRAPIMLLGGMAVTLLLDPVLAAAMIGVLPFIGLTIWYITKKGIPLFTKVQQSADDMVQVVREDTKGIRVIKALSKTAYEKERFERVNEQLSEADRKANTVMAISKPVMTLLLNLGLVAVIFLGANRVFWGLTKVGKIIAFIQYFTLITNAMLSITRIFTVLSKSTASADRIQEVLLCEDALAIPEIHPEESESEKTEQSLKHAKDYIVFDDVSFSYNQKGKHLEHISFSLEKGKTLGIIGPTGAGKTTLIKLLMRFYDPAQGKILIGGKDIRSIRPTRLHKMFGAAMQNDFLYRGTIEENIDFGRQLSTESVQNAAKKAQAEAFIAEYQDGYSHEIASKGADLSGGQKQRLLIARALAGEPEILILDDSSSALDFRTDAALRKEIARLSQEITVIVVAQRISSVMNADCILVMEEGKIIGKGTHKELLQNCAIYREISDSQIGGVLCDE